MLKRKAHGTYNAMPVLGEHSLINFIKIEGSLDKIMPGTFTRS